MKSARGREVESTGGRRVEAMRRGEAENPRGGRAGIAPGKCMENEMVGGVGCPMTNWRGWQRKRVERVPKMEGTAKKRTGHAGHVECAKKFAHNQGKWF